MDTYYQGLYINFDSLDKVSKDADGNMIKETKKMMKGLNVETSRILISDTFNWMMHGNCCLNKAFPMKYFKSFLAQYSPTHGKKRVMMDWG